MNCLLSRASRNRGAGFQPPFRALGSVIFQNKRNTGRMTNDECAHIGGRRQKMKTRRKSHRGKLWEEREFSAGRPTTVKSFRFFCCLLSCLSIRVVYILICCEQYEKILYSVNVKFRLNVITVFAVSLCVIIHLHIITCVSLCYRRIVELYRCAFASFTMIILKAY